MTLLADIFYPELIRKVQTRICIKCKKEFKTIDIFDECNECRKPEPKCVKKCLNCLGEFTSYDGKNFCIGCVMSSWIEYRLNEK